MFYGCASLTNVPQFDTSSATSMSYMFRGCTSLTNVPQFDTSSAFDMGYMFQSCSSITSLPAFDASSVKSITNFAGECAKLTDVGGLVNLGKEPSLSIYASSYSGLFYKCINLTRESVLNIFNGLYDRASAGYSNIKLYLEIDVINRLTEDDIAIATNKGWTISN